MIGRTRRGLAPALLLMIWAGGCASNNEHRANNLFAYLYTDKNGHVDTPSIPVLSLPLRVGVAFVPPDRPGDGANYGHPDDAVFSEAQKMTLMKQISEQFKQYPFVHGIELIPTTYLTSRGGFENLDQLRSIYGVDVMVLLSFDQVQFTDQGLLSLTYWTVVGAYVVPGEKNDTRTMLDAAVYDVASRKLLFRAPGVSRVKGASTPVNLSEQKRADSRKGFDAAAAELVVNLKAQLEDFQERVKSTPTEYKIETKPGYTGAGALGGWDILLLGAMGACGLWTRRRVPA